MHSFKNTQFAAAVIIPARNEIDRISRCLAAVSHALHAARVPGCIVVVDDGSTDGTPVLARAFLQDSPFDWAVLSVDLGVIGSVRRFGFATAAQILQPCADPWLLSTDADSVVPVDWVQRYHRHAVSGAHAVAGVVTLTPDADSDDIEDAWTRGYGSTLLADGTHPHVHAANLGLDTTSYDAAGGFAHVSTREDVELWGRLKATGIEPVADSGLVVKTSARRIGRVEKGFSTAINELYRSPGAAVAS